MIYLKTSLGIELRGEDMLISSLQSNFSGGTFTHFKRITNYRLSDKEALRNEINTFFKSHSLSKENIVLGIPRNEVILRYLDLPSEVAENIKQVVRYQVQSFEPTEEDKFYYDYALLNNNSAQKRLEVLLVMVKKALLDNHLNFLLELGIRPTMVIGSSMGLSNLFLQNQKDVRGKTFILADVGASSLELVALRRGSFVYSHESFKEGDQNWRDLILHELDEATSKMRFESETIIDNILLSGESSVAAHQELRILIPDCALIQDAIPITIPEENKSHLQDAASTLGLAFTGMAHRPNIRMNLLPDNLRSRQTRLAYVPAALFGLAIMVLLIALGFHQVVQNRTLIRKLDKEIQALKTPVDRVQSYRNKADSLEKRIKSFEELLRKRDMNLEIMRELTILLPTDTFLSTYQYRDGTITLTGSSNSSSDLIPKLEKSSLLKEVVQKGPIFPDGQTGKDRFTFEAKLEK
jgi:Tfp pilus assembly protein PilN